MVALQQHLLASMVPSTDEKTTPELTEHQIAVKEAQHKGWQLGYTEAWSNANNGDLPSHPPLDDAGGPWVEEQVKPPVEEPTTFGSIVEAAYDERSERCLWQRGPTGWFADVPGGFHAYFAGLHKPEVLRVGVDGGPTDNVPAFTKGVEAAKTTTLTQLRELYAGAITSERQSAYANAIAVVEAL
jgi:hypothetical protein